MMVVNVVVGGGDWSELETSWRAPASDEARPDLGRGEENWGEIGDVERVSIRERLDREIF